MFDGMEDDAAKGGSRASQVAAAWGVVAVAENRVAELERELARHKRMAIMFDHATNCRIYNPIDVPLEDRDCNCGWERSVVLARELVETDHCDARSWGLRCDLQSPEHEYHAATDGFGRRWSWRGHSERRARQLLEECDLWFASPPSPARELIERIRAHLDRGGRR
jgi:hypothetical protein